MVFVVCDVCGVCVCVESVVFVCLSECVVYVCCVFGVCV